MAKGLKRFYGQGHLHFITFSCYHRLPLLEAGDARTLFLEELSDVRQEYKFSLVGYVVMPNHVHLLASEPRTKTLSTVLQMLKQRVSRGMRWGGGRQGQSSKENQLPRFWQLRSYDFNVYSHNKKEEKLDYMHANPVARGLVRHPGDWRWSSFGFYVTGKAGLIDIDVVNL